MKPRREAVIATPVSLSKKSVFVESGVSVFRERKSSRVLVLNHARYGRVALENSLPFGDLLLVKSFEAVDLSLGLLVQMAERVHVLQADDAVGHLGNAWASVKREASWSENRSATHVPW
jgi:hypothetical protein